jgi:mannonate dehydratase
MKRREFGQKIVTGAMGAGLSGSIARGTTSAPGAAAPRRNTLMHVGGDYHSVAGSGITSRENLQYNLRYGVKHLTVELSQTSPEGAWDQDEIRRMKDDCDHYGVHFEAIRMDASYITLRKGPERDRKLDTIIGNIQKASEAGVKIITYHWTVIPIRRNSHRPGRGGSTYEAFQLEENWRDLPVGRSGKVSSEDYWERIGYFLEKVIPAAKQADVRLACHPYDPPGLPFGYQGADNWDSPSIFPALQRYESLVDSPYNGFQLCLGTTAEGLKDPRREILPIVQYLGARKKIYQIHMRNIRGGLHNFAEVYPDEGEMDFFQVMRILRDTQFAGSIFPDHMPRHPDDPGGLQSYAFGYGYIGALIQAVNSEVTESG